MKMYCKYLSKSLNGKLRCKLFKVITYINECQKCLKFEPRKNKAINKRSVKQNKIEKERDSKIIKSGICENCHRYFDKLDPHEVYGGSNRKRSIRNNFVALLCRECHSNNNVIKELKIKYQKEFEKNHTRDEFIKIIGKNYIKEEIK